MRPYIGITGFKTVEEVRRLDHIVQSVSADDPHTVPALMFGYLCSAKRMSDVTQGGKQSPPAKDIAALAEAAPRGTIPMVHYFSRNHAGLADEVDAVFSMGLYDHCKALQINMDWPSLDQIRHIRDTYTEMDIVLQLPARAMAGITHEETVSRASEYSGLVDYCLIDPSGGEGKDMIVGSYIDLMRGLDAQMPQTMIGIAGGFSGDNVAERVRDIKKGFSEEFFIDAQGKLRTNGELDISKVETYVRNSSIAMGGSASAK